MTSFLDDSPRIREPSLYLEASARSDQMPAAHLSVTDFWIVNSVIKEDLFHRFHVHVVLAGVEWITPEIVST